MRPRLPKMCHPADAPRLTSGHHEGQDEQTWLKSNRIAAPDEKVSWACMTEVSRLADRTLVTSAVRGDPVVGRALALLLSPYCGVRCLAVSPLRPGALRDVRLLLLAPTPDLSAKRREAHLGSLRGDRARAYPSWSSSSPPGDTGRI
jgi:hypothetical protein